MHNIIIAVLITLFVGVVATSYYYDYKIKKASLRLRTELPTALDVAYQKGYDAGYMQGGTDSKIAERILNQRKN